MTESDWKAFRRIVPGLRERYVKKQIVEIEGLLKASDLSDTERFWNAYEKMSKEAGILRKCLDGHKRSNMMAFIYEMLALGLMEPGDLAVFSQELQDRAGAWYDEGIIRTPQFR